jgi:hypothetical protein
VRFHFDRYNSEDRGQDFVVDVEWSDVLIAIERFVKHGDRPAHPGGAARLCRAGKRTKNPTGCRRSLSPPGDSPTARCCRFG